MFSLGKHRPKMRAELTKCWSMKILKTKGSEVPKKFFSKPNVLGLALHQWQKNDFQITRLRTTS